MNTNRIITSGQIHDLLGVIVQTSFRLQAAGSSLETGEDLKQDMLQGEGPIALERTLIHACERLSDILNDESRWKLPPADAQDLLLVNLTQTVQIQRTVLEQERAKTEAIIQHYRNGGAFAEPESPGEDKPTLPQQEAQQ